MKKKQVKTIDIAKEKYNNACYLLDSINTNILKAEQELDLLYKMKEKVTAELHVYTTT